MPKKKKTQLKPGVARGFATTSIPKKAAQEEETAPPAVDVPPSNGFLVIKAATETLPDQAALRGVPQDPVKSDAERDEQQIMVDKYQEKTEKELSRAIKARPPSVPVFVPSTLTLHSRRLKWIGVSRKSSTRWKWIPLWSKRFCVSILKKNNTEVAHFSFAFLSSTHSHHSQRDITLTIPRRKPCLASP